MTKVVKRQTLSYSTKDMKIVFGKLSSEASVLGAGSIASEKHFEIPALKPLRFMIESHPGPPRFASRRSTGSIWCSLSVLPIARLRISSELRPSCRFLGEL